MADELEILAIPETRVAYMRNVGPYGSPDITDMWRRLTSWCAPRGLLSPGRRLFGIAQDNPNITPADQTRYDACVEVDWAFHPSGEIAVQTIRGGRYACTPFHGTSAEVRGAWVK